jgi:hypothetical protein
MTRRRHVVVSLMSGRRRSYVPVILMTSLMSGRRRSYVPVILMTSHDRPLDVIHDISLGPLELMPDSNLRHFDSSTNSSQNFT